MRRQGDAFGAAGWQVVGVGMPGGISEAPAWPILTGDGSRPNRSFENRIRAALLGWLMKLEARPQVWAKLLSFAFLLLAQVRLFPSLLAARLSNGRAYKLYWRSSGVQHVYGLARTLSADVWLANDWNTLPIAARLAQERGGIYCYDTHEFATAEYSERLTWRLLRQPFVMSIEAQAIKGAKIISTVSDGIAEALRRQYPGIADVLVVRNTPSYVETPFRATGTRIRVLYHGILAPGRGLEAAIDSVKFWRAEYDLTLRGPGQPTYIAGLKRRIEEQGVAGRISIVPPVPMTELVQEATHFDIGFFALPGHSEHNEFALPNKLFEYLMAGLAVCVSGLPEMMRVVRERDVGVLITSLDPTSIASAINTMDQEAVDKFRAAALNAARDLCWENEGKRLVSAYQVVAENG